jgi:hypothetical protein
MWCLETLTCDDHEGPRSRKEEDQEDKHYPEPASGFFLKCTPLKQTVRSFLYVCTILACIMNKIFLNWK